jgi:hypothetical protein
MDDSDRPLTPRHWAVLGVLSLGPALCTPSFAGEVGEQWIDQVNRMIDRRQTEAIDQGDIGSQARRREGIPPVSGQWWLVAVPHLVRMGDGK